MNEQIESRVEYRLVEYQERIAIDRSRLCLYDNDDGSRSLNIMLLGRNQIHINYSPSGLDKDMKHTSMDYDTFIKRLSNEFPELKGLQS